MVVVSLSGAGGTGFLVEEEADFGKFPDSHLSFLFGMGRRNEIRQRLMGHTFTRAGYSPGHVKGQCEFEDFTKLLGTRDMYILKTFHL